MRHRQLGQEMEFLVPQNALIIFNAGLVEIGELTIVDWMRRSMMTPMCQMTGLRLYDFWNKSISY